jgi:error-prone DNA polymerase
MGFYSPHTLVHDAARHGVVTVAPDVNISVKDCTLEPAAPGVATPAIAAGFEARCSRHVVRLGLRYVRNLSDTSIERLLLARDAGGPFGSPEVVARRTGLSVDALEALAAAGAFESLGYSRRQALWAAGAAASSGPGRLALELGSEAPASIPPMDALDAARSDLWSMQMSPAHHPTSFVREQLERWGCIAISKLGTMPHGKKVRVGGMVTHRQRPGTARGVIFFNLEDESGMLNVIVLPDVYQAHLPMVRRVSGLAIEGVLERQDGAINLLARKMRPLPAPVSPPDARNFR